MGARLPTRGSRHVEPPYLDGETIRSGDGVAPIVRRGRHASVGEGDDGSIWILVHDPERRPRGRDPGVVVESAAVRYEQNGLVRVLDRRVSPDAIERLVGDLTGEGARSGGASETTSGIPAGDYAGIVVEPLGEHYRVSASGTAAKRLAGMQPLGAGRWLVLAGEESRLRRELVSHLMPTHGRVLWAMVRNGSRLLVGIAALFAAASIVTPLAAPLALLALGALGLLHWRRREILARVRRRWVEPYVNRTVAGHGAGGAEPAGDGSVDPALTRPA